MAAARSAAKGLSTADIQALNAAVEAGRRPKVVFTDAAGQIAGQTGQVTGLGDPALDDEWITVRFGKDELPFAPIDLRLAPKPARKRTPPPAAPVPDSATSATAGAAPRPDGTLGAPSLPKESTMPKATSDSAAPAQPAPAGQDKPPAQTAAKAAARPAAARKPRAKAAPDLSVTLSWRDGEWTVQAHRGARALAKPAPVRASDALKMVSLLDSAEVADVVTEIVAADRSAAEDQAERLRRELAEVEARLAELPEVD